VVAKGHDVRARRQKLVRQLGREAYAVRRVLAVHDAEVDGELLLQARQPLLDRAASRRSDDVGDNKKLQGIESVAAG
jgi:hypothetical protein